MKEQKFRYSAEREEILEVLCSTKIHPTAEWIYEQLQEQESKISLATIYRNLDILCQQRRAKKLDIQGEKQAYYDGCIDEHAHFFCKKNNSIHDIPRFQAPLNSCEQYLSCNKCSPNKDVHDECPLDEIHNNTL